MREWGVHIIRCEDCGAGDDPCAHARCVSVHPTRAEAQAAARDLGGWIQISEDDGGVCIGEVADVGRA